MTWVSTCKTYEQIQSISYHSTVSKGRLKNQYRGHLSGNAMFYYSLPKTMLMLWDKR